MASLLLAVAAVVWLIAGVAGIGIGLAGAGWLMDQLPPLTIGADAVGGAAVAFGGALLVLAILHAVVAVGAGARRRWAVSSGILLSATMSIALVAAALAAATTYVRGSPAPVLVATGAAAAIGGAAVYGWCAVRLVRMLGVPRPGSAP
jgi:hypothetical protein